MARRKEPAIPTSKPSSPLPRAFRTRPARRPKARSSMATRSTSVRSTTSRSRSCSKIARDLEVENATGMRKQDLIFAILEAQTEKNGLIFGEGVLEILPDGFGFLRAPDYNYLPGPGRHLRLALADPRASICAPATPCRDRSGRPRKGSATSPCSRSRRSTTSDPDEASDKILFDNLTPLYPQRS